MLFIFSTWVQYLLRGGSEPFGSVLATEGADAFLLVLEQPVWLPQGGATLALPGVQDFEQKFDFQQIPTARWHPARPLVLSELALTSWPCAPNARRDGRWGGLTLEPFQSFLADHDTSLAYCFSNGAGSVPFSETPFSTEAKGSVPFRE